MIVFLLDSLEELLYNLLKIRGEMLSANWTLGVFYF